jgi:protein-S-isoprenylcysteine O-methyltransferase Ste14
MVIGIVLAGLRHYEYPGHSHRLDQFWEIVCLIIAFLGLGVRVLTIGYTPKYSSGRNTRTQRADVLNTTGMYSIVRHPLYLGNFIIWLGISLFLHLWWICVIFILAFWLYYERIMFAEEAFLRNKFGDVYTAWAMKTPAFIPRFSNWQTPSNAFSFKKVLRREYSGFFAIVVSFTLLEIIGDTVLEGKPQMDSMWVGIFIVGLVAYFALRLLKKKTNILQD